MKKFFMTFIILLLTACPTITVTFPIKIKNIYYDEVYIYTSANDKLLHLKKDDVWYTGYGTYGKSFKLDEIRYYVYKDKEKKFFITSFVNKDFKLGIGNNNILSFSGKGLFKLND